LTIKISIDRNTKNNTSIIKIEKNNSGNSGEHNLSPENESLSPDSDSLSPILSELSPENIEDLIKETALLHDYFKSFFVNDLF